MVPFFTARPPVESDFATLAYLMRAEDRLECAEVAGLRPEEALRQSARVSDVAYTCFHRGEMVCMCGARRDGGSLMDGAPGVIWLLGSAAAEEIPVSFWRATHAVFGAIGAALPDVPWFSNAVRETNTVSRRWLTALGARWDDETAAAPFGNGLYRSFILDNPFAWRR